MKKHDHLNTVKDNRSLAGRMQLPLTGVTETGYTHSVVSDTCESVVHSFEACRVGVAYPGDLHWCCLHGHHAKPIVGCLSCQLNQHLHAITSYLHHGTAMPVTCVCIADTACALHS